MVTTEQCPATLKVHVFAQLFPVLSDDELRALADDIQEHGQRHDVVTDEKGEILDGRNRAAACALIGISPRTTVFTGTDEEKMAFVISANMHRRHLTESQRAMIAADIATITRGSNQHQRKQDAHAVASTDRPAQEDLGGKFPQGQNAHAVASTDRPAPLTQGQAATAFAVSRRSVQRAKVVLDRGSADIVTEVRTGRMTVATAERSLKARPAHTESIVTEEVRERLRQDAINAMQEYRDMLRKHHPHKAQEVDQAVEAIVNEVFSKVALMRAKLRRNQVFASLECPQTSISHD